MTRPSARDLTAALLPLVAAATGPRRREDLALLVEDLDPDVARALVPVLVGAYVDAFRLQGVRDEHVRPLVQGVLAALHADPPAGL